LLKYNKTQESLKKKKGIERREKGGITVTFGLLQIKYIKLRGGEVQMVIKRKRQTKRARSFSL